MSDIKASSMVGGYDTMMWPVIPRSVLMHLHGHHAEGKFAYCPMCEVIHLRQLLGEDVGRRIIDAMHIERQRAWSRHTFGPGDRLDGVLDHLSREMEEVRESPDDVSEWADLLILVLDGAWRSGHEPQEIIDAVHAKQKVNEDRKWPDWRDAEPNRAIEHVREGDSHE